MIKQYYLHDNVYHYRLGVKGQSVLDFFMLWDELPFFASEYNTKIRIEDEYLVLYFQCDWLEKGFEEVDHSFYLMIGEDDNAPVL